MKKKLKIIFSLIILVSIIGILYITGQEHTVIIDNKYENKKLSQKIEVIFEGEKLKKVGPNKKVLMEVKGYKRKFIVKGENFQKEFVLDLPLNKGIEINIENLLNDKKDWAKKILLY
ncbi:DUF6672 family protein [Cetobacterium sp. SF1]|uniref:DUF6672 family protein n=1 Tax=unclassified Cetobacterium TaxID=2630983 RepID=UPI003CED54B2